MKNSNNETKKHPTAFEPLTLLIIVALGIVGAIIGLQLITSLGISANTSIIGALFAMIIARIPIRMFIKFRSVHRQNIVQTAISAATFGAANSLLLPIGIPFVMGMPELIIPMFIGVTCAMFIDAILLYKFFDTKVFPAKEAWPPGIATAEAIKAGDEGGNRAKLLGVGIGIGILGAILKIPMSAFGVAFIGNIWALTMFGIGLLLRGYSTPLLGIDLNEHYIPHGFMIGAGLVALIQVVFIIVKKKKNIIQNHPSDDQLFTRSEKDLSQGFGYGFIAYTAIALLLALLGGIITDMSFGMLIGFMLFAAFAAFVHELIVGIAAMHSGWFPAFAVALITLIIGMLIGFPTTALAILVGFSASTGVAFADMGYDLKTGYMLRGNGEDPKFEKNGRRQQLYAGLIAFGVAAIVVLLSYNNYFMQDLVPPVDRVYAATIEAGVSTEVAKQLVLWAIPGALLQLIGGPKRQMGVLFSTGLLIFYPIAGWTVLAGILIRSIVLKVKGKEAEIPMSILAAGFIAGDALYNFFNSIIKASK
ncbi:OPT/YSL family transporter [Pseudalkalibacillus decolorationis]|uniref:OPT/YSL family transporter n=1 Tax=Pseudalkalibacillus decolorationis TaxID=163879 RepID=UPI002147E66D|nr:OPT/YSL family transporter [Pseudalkalibacillus decolorationis]